MFATYTDYVSCPAVRVLVTIFYFSAHLSRSKVHTYRATVYIDYNVIVHCDVGLARRWVEAGVQAV